MAFGIDDVLMSAAAGISLTDTVVRTIEAYRKKKVFPSILRCLLRKYASPLFNVSMKPMKLLTSFVLFYQCYAPRPLMRSVGWLSQRNLCNEVKT